MLVIGLCGGSGSGKSTVATILSSRNILHIDTDKIYRQMISSPSACTTELANEFGRRIINLDGSVDRKFLAEIVFSDKDKHSALNRITHKHVLASVRDIISNSKEYFAVCVDAPMLFESGFDKECDVLVAVVSPIDNRIKRITERDNISVEAAKKRIGAQISDNELISKVDFVIYNNNDITMLETTVDELLEYVKNKIK